MIYFSLFVNAISTSALKSFVLVLNTGMHEYYFLNYCRFVTLLPKMHEVCKLVSVNSTFTGCFIPALEF